MSSPRTTSDPTKAILSESALNGKYLCDYVANVASGCAHGCEFCYVPATPSIRTRQDMLKAEVDVDDPQTEWGDYVLYRDSIPAELPRLLEGKQKWKNTRGGQGVVLLCSGTDPFQDPRAGDIAIQAIHALVENGRDVRVLTRNPVLAANGRVDDPVIDLPSKAYHDVLSNAANTGHLTVGSSINSLNTEYLEAIEPGAPAPSHRLRGLQQLSDADIPVYVSMSPTLPTADESDLRELMDEIAALDPTVIFTEVINPRGDNYQGMIDAAWKHGHDKLGGELARLRRNEIEWKEYALGHYKTIQRIATDNDLPIHIWPDSKLLSLVTPAQKAWLLAWFHRHPPEQFAGRPAPSFGRPVPPGSQTNLSTF